jgi:hypothetical protein
VSVGDGTRPARDHRAGVTAGVRSSTRRRGCWRAVGDAGINRWGCEVLRYWPVGGKSGFVRDGDIDLSTWGVVAGLPPAISRTQRGQRLDESEDLPTLGVFGAVVNV